MPIPIDRSRTRAMRGRFDEALTLVTNEFAGLDGDRQYRNAFARLLKPDPLERVVMLGTDQRDHFVPALRALVPTVVPPGGRVLDLGGGDGRTFALIADRLPRGTQVSILEPNTGYVDDYLSYLRTQPHLATGRAMVTGFDEVDAAAPPPPDDSSVHLVLALHMLYFLADPGAGLVRMARFLEPGGVLCVVVADETNGYTGRSLRAFLDSGARLGPGADPLASIARREALFGETLPGILSTALPDRRFEVETHRQPSRLYGHTLADLIALSTIAELAEVEGTDKFAAARDLLCDTPEAVGLRIEDGGPRKGMWSVSQPQFLTILRRAAL